MPPARYNVDDAPTQCFHTSSLRDPDARRMRSSRQHRGREFPGVAAMCDRWWRPRGELAPGVCRESPRALSRPAAGNLSLPCSAVGLYRVSDFFQSDLRIANARAGIIAGAEFAPATRLFAS